MEKETFKPIHHIPHFSMLIFRSLRTPILVYTAFIGNAITFACAFLFYRIEEEINPNVVTFFDALWWAFCTVTTVGYGDVVPMTPEGRFVALFLMVVGILFFVGFTAVLVAIIAPMAIKEQLDPKN